jgi:phosphohistidine phosphatase
LLRHGKSPSLVEAGVAKDEDRPLSDLGRQQGKRAGKALDKLGSRPALILCSPLLRARTTAEHAQKGLGGDVELKVFEPLGSGADPRALLASLAPYAGRKALLLVGHQPDLGAFASLLVSGEDSAGISLKPGGMLLIDAEDLSGRGGAQLRWLMLPTQIEALA